MDRVAVVIPHPYFPFNADQMISYRHLQKHLRNYDWYFVCPKSLSVDLRDMEIVRVPDDNMSSRLEYSRMMISPEFYLRFRKYEYILIYQLDCLVFSDELIQWCDRGWDYIGAPWLKNYGNNAKSGFQAVGNGGFSLRNVESHIKVLMQGEKSIETIHKFRTSLGAGHENEDGFWSYYAKKVIPEFKVPEPQAAIPFSFECDPRQLFRMHGNQLPFGCHAWERWDRPFWESHIAADCRE